MKKYYLLLLFALAALCTQAEEKIPFPYGHYRLYRVQLTDKRGTQYSLKHPEKFLSEKALQRRAKQGLKVDSTDLPLSKKYLDKLRKAGFNVVGGSKWNNTVLVKDDADSCRASFEESLLRLPFVTKVTKVLTTPDSIGKPEQFRLAQDSDVTHYYGDTRYGLALSQIKICNGVPLHDAGYRGKGMLIAVIDGGFSNVDSIPYFSEVNIVGAKDFVYPYTSNVYRELDHGTMVLSTLATNDPRKFIGTAPEASYLLLRSEYGPTESLSEEDFWAQAAEYADSMGVDVINTSLGYNHFDDRSTNHTYREQDGMTALISRSASMLAGKGIILVNSAGNEGGGSWKRIGFPGDAHDVLTVAALRPDSINASFSSVGPAIDGRVKPDVSAQGYDDTVIDGNGLIVSANGTSFSSPTLCGLVACLWQAMPDKTAHEIMDLIRRSADRYDHPDNVYGYGIPNFGAIIGK